MQQAVHAASCMDLLHAVAKLVAYDNAERGADAEVQQHDAELPMATRLLLTGLSVPLPALSVPLSALHGNTTLLTGRSTARRNHARRRRVCVAGGTSTSIAPPFMAALPSSAYVRVPETSSAASNNPAHSITPSRAGSTGTAHGPVTWAGPGADVGRGRHRQTAQRAQP
jgi:hypothetical protein